MGCGNWGAHPRGPFRPGMQRSGGRDRRATCPCPEAEASAPSPPRDTVRAASLSAGRPIPIALSSRHPAARGKPLERLPARPGRFYPVSASPATPFPPGQARASRVLRELPPGQPRPGTRPPMGALCLCNPHSASAPAQAGHLLTPGVPPGAASPASVRRKTAWFTPAGKAQGTGLAKRSRRTQPPTPTPQTGRRGVRACQEWMRPSAWSTGPPPRRHGRAAERLRPRG